jgi:phage terminase small subunit
LKEPEIKLTPKQEAFALAYVETGNASEAYRQAYNPKNAKASWIASEACKTLADSNVSQMVAILRVERRNRAAVTAASLTEELEEARALAVAEKQSSAAVSATMGKARINGLIVERREVGGFDGAPIKVETTDRSPRDLAKAVLALIGKAKRTDESSG